MIITFTVAAFLVWLLTGLVRHYAVSNNVLDLPNARSAHVLPTPIGGGLALTLVISLGIALLHAEGEVSAQFAYAAIGGGAVTAAVGWLDDRRGLKVSVRALAHFIAAIWAVSWLGGFPYVRLGSVGVRLGPLGFVFAVVMIVWLINLYNFMDGIDGIAGVNALSVGSIGAFLLLWSGSFGLAAVAVIVAGASLGFLIWNWSPAKIFLGDVGSGSLGFYFGTIAVASENSAALPVVIWVLLLGVFMFDSTVTLVRRVFRREQWYAAHNNHAYQRAVQAGYSHSRVALTVAMINIGLGALAALAVRYAPWFFPIVAVAILFLLLIYLGVETINPMKSRA